MLHRQWARGVRTASFGIIAEGGRLVETPVALARNYAHHYNLVPPPSYKCFQQCPPAPIGEKQKFSQTRIRLTLIFLFKRKESRKKF
jgi:hypothetical protein